VVCDCVSASLSLHQCIGHGREPCKNGCIRRPPMRCRRRHTVWARWTVNANCFYFTVLPTVFWAVRMRGMSRGASLLHTFYHRNCANRKWNWNWKYNFDHLAEVHCIIILLCVSKHLGSCLPQNLVTASDNSFSTSCVTCVSIWISQKSVFLIYFQRCLLRRCYSRERITIFRQRQSSRQS